MEFIIAVVLSYFLPTIICGFRKNPNWGSIFVVNLFFGWTLVGWVICLAWAVAPKKKTA